MSEHTKSISLNKFCGLGLFEFCEIYDLTYMYTTYIELYIITRACMRMHYVQALPHHAYFLHMYKQLPTGDEERKSSSSREKAETHDYF